MLQQLISVIPDIPFSITSLAFLITFIISIGIYYLAPKRGQWVVLLLYSVAFYLISSKPILILWLLGAVIATTIGINLIRAGNSRGNHQLATAGAVIGIAANLGMLLAARDLLKLAPLGISFYTMQAIAYVLDAYWGITEPDGDLLHNGIFIGYYPQLTSGPIARHEQMHGQLFAAHRFDFVRITSGLQRMLWGIFKKLVISARVGIVVDTIYADPATYHGLYIWMAMFLFMLQLYTDFSGCMDIVLGASECYGIDLPENFRTPFFSRSVQEYWQRWHITLGEWLKDYILYPLLRSKLFRSLGNTLKKRLGRKAARQIPSYLGMLCVWLLIGFWHGGGVKFVLGMGLWFFLCILTEQLMSPIMKRVTDRFGVDTEAFGWHLLQSLRVFLLVSVGNVFFRVESLSKIKQVFKAAVTGWNPWIFFDDSLYQLGISAKEVHLVIVSVLVLIIVSALSVNGSVREKIARQNIVFRWSIWLSLILVIVIFGKYGPGFDSSAFIYQQF